MLISILFNISSVFKKASMDLSGNLAIFNSIILQRLLNPLRNYFFALLLILITCISLFNISIAGFALINYQSAMLLLLITSIGVYLTYRGLSGIQRIIELAINEKLEIINGSIEQNMIKLKLMLETKNEEKNNEIDKIQKIIAIEEKEWEKITNVKNNNTIKESLREAGIFIITIMIPIISFLISSSKELQDKKP
jgi:hypothetical protein